MTQVLFLLVAAGALGSAVYVMILFRGIRRTGFGEGRDLEVSGLGVSLRHPAWWEADPSVPPPAARLLTGHHRGELSLTPDPPSLRASREEPSDLAARLQAILLEKRIVLDDPGVRLASRPHRASVSGGGRFEGDEQRHHFELHLVEIQGHRVLFLYTNSVLQGFLDAWYIEKTLETMRPGPG